MVFLSGIYVKNCKIFTAEKLNIKYRQPSFLLLTKIVFLRSQKNPKNVFVGVHEFLVWYIIKFCNLHFFNVHETFKTTVIW